MTIGVPQDRKTVWNGDDTADDRYTTFIFWDNDEVEIWHYDGATAAYTQLAEGVDYALAGGSGATGTVTPTDPIASTDKWVGVRVTKHNQDQPYATESSFPSAATERVLDRAAIARQDLDFDRESSLRVPAYEIDDTYRNQLLPAKADRASTTLCFDTDGQVICSAGAVDSSLVAVTAAGKALIEKATIALMRGYLDVFEDVFSALGDLLVGGAAGAEQRLAMGAVGEILKPEAAGLAWRRVGVPGFVSGLRLSVNAGTQTNLDCTAGSTQDSTGLITMVASAAPTTRTPNAEWTPAGPGGRANGAAAWNTVTQLHVFLMSTPDGETVTLVFDESVTCGNGLTDPDLAAYTKWKRLGTVHRNVTQGTNIEKFRTVGDWVLFDKPFDWWESVNTIDNTKRTFAVETPKGLETLGLFNIRAEDAGANFRYYISGFGQDNMAPQTGAPPISTSYIASAMALGQQHQGLFLATLDSGVPKIGVRADAAGPVDDFECCLLGYFDPIGRLP